MLTLLVNVGTLAALGSLLVAGWAHARNPNELAGTLRQQRVWPTRIVPGAARVIGPLEIALGAASLVHLTWRSNSPSLLIFPAVASLLLFSYGVYSLFVLTRRPGAPCGCSAGNEPMTSTVPIRAFVYGTALGAAAVQSRPVVVLDGTLSQAAVTLLAALAIGITAWILPNALYDPLTQKPSTDGLTT